MFYRRPTSILVCTIWLFLAVQTAAAQRIAVLTPDRSSSSTEFAETLIEALSPYGRVLDSSLAEAAYASSAHATPFNMETAEARILGSAIGCDVFLVVKAAVQRRSSFEKDEYYEAYAAVYAVSSRTGRLAAWRLLSNEDPTSAAAWQHLLSAVPKEIGAMMSEVSRTLAGERSELPRPTLEEVPEPGSAAAKGLKAPIPYNRIKPAYTPTAALHDVTATVDIEVDLDAAGAIQRTEIVRWAGFGLDESVEKAVRSMNWRPAERSGKPLPMRFLLRYNFKKIDRQ